MAGMKYRAAAALLAAGVFGTGPRLAAAAAPSAVVAEKGVVMAAIPGFIPLYWNSVTGRLWMEIPRFDSDFLYQDSLPAGVGSNDIGLDGGQLGRGRVVRFTRSGPRILLVERNESFRAPEGSAAEQAAVRDSFAESVVWGFDVAEERPGRVLVDATDFFLRDVHDVAGTLKEAKQGTFTLDPRRSAFYLPGTKGFPRNTEVEVVLTFAGNDPGDWVKDVAPDPHSVTVRERHSLIQLPDDGYQPRRVDPRAGYFSIDYADYSAPIGEPVAQSYVLRHRLVKKDPAAARSEPLTPIVYYLDPATPEPIRSALLDGARWWDQAFEAAGFIHAFRVEMLPEGADMLDVRYNTIEWVHRATRGWSYGNAVIDPRTGEIIQGHVSLGSLRVRQDYLIAEGLLAPYGPDGQASPAMREMVLARLRQLAAHEVGHTLGLAHNFVSSSEGRSSVMDYPFPLLGLKDDATVDLAKAYAVGIGEWDKVAISWGYFQAPPGTAEGPALNAIIDRARARGLTFLTDQDARPLGSAHPHTHLWDNGTDPVDELNRLLRIRAAALSRFGEQVIRLGRPMATIEEPLVVIYLLHRYQLEAAAKVVGGQDYSSALRGDGQVPVAQVDAAEQLRALDALLAALSPEVLRLPPGLLEKLPPRPSGFPATRELFARRTGLTFDALAPAEAAADLTFALIFHPERAARLVQQHALDDKLPGLAAVIARVLEVTWRAEPGKGYDAELHRSVDTAALNHLIALAANPAAAPQARAISQLELRQLKSWIDAGHEGRDDDQIAHLTMGAALIGRFLGTPKEFEPASQPVVPPGQPIGAGEELSSDFEVPGVR